MDGETLEDQAPEAELVARAKRGGREGRQAFGSLVARHQARLVRYLTHLLGSQAEAEDVAQDTFARGYLSLGRLRDDARFGAWLRRTATRLAFNHQRSRSTRRAYERRARPTDSTVRNGSAQHADREAIFAVFARLSYPYREALVLFYVEELEIKEIAQLLDIGMSAAKMRVSRARREFKAIYEEVTLNGDSG